MSTIPTITKPAYWVQLSKNGKRLFWPGVFYNEQAARGQAHVYAENIGASGYSVFCADPKTGLVTVALYGDDQAEALGALKQIRGESNNHAYKGDN